MNEHDIAKIARQSAKNLKLPSRRKRLFQEWVEDMHMLHMLYTFPVLLWYCKIMYKIVPEKYKSRYRF
jgi:hypothetical protein